MFQLLAGRLLTKFLGLGGSCGLLRSVGRKRASLLSCPSAGALRAHILGIMGIPGIFGIPGIMPATRIAQGEGVPTSVGPEISMIRLRCSLGRR